MWPKRDNAKMINAALQGLEHTLCLARGGKYMERDRLRASMRHLGLNDSNYKVLKLLPLVYVAWANGRMEPEQEERIVLLAHNHFKVGYEGEQLLRKWIKKRPTAEYFKEGLHDIFLLSMAPDEWGFDVDELQGLLAHAEAIGRSCAEAMDAPSALDPQERQALRDLAVELGVDDGESWAELMDELG